MAKIPEEILDLMAELEVKALIEGLKDEELKRSPAFLEKVRKFLKDNRLDTAPGTSMKLVQAEEIKEIPIFDDM